MNRLLVAILVPIVGLIAWLGSIQFQLSSGIPVRLKIAAYDPRDLLAGHYLLFSLALGSEAQCASGLVDTCVCIQPDSGGVYHQAYWSGQCSQRPSSCSLYIKGQCQYGTFSTGVEQYFIPESLAPVLQRVPDNSSISAIVASNGTLRVTALHVGEESVEAYAERLLGVK